MIQQSLWLAKERIASHALIIAIADKCEFEKFIYRHLQMLDDHYKTDASEAFKTFVFISEGPNGNVTKVVRYTEINIKGFYNLGFGDQDPITGYVSDKSRTDNKDSEKVLATVVSTLYIFMQVYPDAVVIATGSTESRTRLYRIGITRRLETIVQNFIVLGLTKYCWENFRKGIEYGAFSVQRKIVALRV